MRSFYSVDMCFVLDSCVYLLSIHEDAWLSRRNNADPEEHGGLLEGHEIGVLYIQYNPRT